MAFYICIVLSCLLQPSHGDSVEILRKEGARFSEYETPGGKVVEISLTDAWHGNDRVLEELVNIEDLRRIYVSSNVALSDVGFAHLGTIPNVERLTLHSQEITRDRVVMVSRLTRLQYLDMTNCSVDNRCLQVISSIKTLEFLDLSSSNVDTSELDRISGLPRLQSLYLVNVHFTDIGTANLRKLKMLRKLVVQDSNIDDDALAAINELKNLEVLSLGETDVSTNGVRTLHLPRLTALDVQGTTVEVHKLPLQLRLAAENVNQNSEVD